MRDYTTLGAGKSTKVLSVTEHGPARVVTSTSAETAPAIAAALRRTDRTLLAALQPLAQALDGGPVQAHRRLLNVYDTAAAAPPGQPAPLGSLGDPTGPDGTSLWKTATRLVAELGAAVAGTGPAVTSAVREELTDHLRGLDGVLVPAWVVGYDGKFAGCPVLLNPALGDNPDAIADLLDAGPDVLMADDDLFPLGGPVFVLDDEFAHELYDQEAIGSGRYDAYDVAELLTYAATSNGYTEVYVRGDHLTAWAAAVRATASN